MNKSVQVNPILVLILCVLCYLAGAGYKIRQELEQRVIALTPAPQQGQPDWQTYQAPYGISITYSPLEIQATPVDVPGVNRPYLLGANKLPLDN